MRALGNVDSPPVTRAEPSRCSSFHKAFDARPTHLEAMKSAMKSKAMKISAKAMTKAQLAVYH